MRSTLPLEHEEERGATPRSSSWRNVVLQDQERVLHEYRASFTPFALAYGIAGGGLLAVSTLTALPFLYGLPALAIAVALHALVHRQYRWALTRERIIMTSGILVRRTRIVPLHRVTDLEVVRPLLAMALGTGSVTLSTAGAPGPQVVVFGQHHPKAVEREIASVKRLHYPENAA